MYLRLSCVPQTFLILRSFQDSGRNIPLQIVDPTIIVVFDIAALFIEVITGFVGDAERLLTDLDFNDGHMGADMNLAFQFTVGNGPEVPAPFQAG